MNNEVGFNLNKKMNYTNYDLNNYKFESNNRNYANPATTKVKARNIPINMKQNNNSKSPNNFISNPKYSNNTYKNFNKLNNKNLNINYTNNNMQRNAMKGKSFTKNNNNNNIIPGKNVNEIQERFDKLQDKINILQNVITNQDPSKDLIILTCLLTSALCISSII